MIDTNTVIGAWKTDIKELYENRWQYKVREGILNLLFKMLVDHGVSLEDAKITKTIVVKFLVTEEGIKGKGKHKDWANNVKQEFDHLLLEYYEEHAKNGIIVKDYGKGDFLAKDSVITAWAKDKFGIAWNENFNLMTHQVGNRFNLEFQKDVFESDWVKSGTCIPEWFQKLGVDLSK